MAKPKQLLQTVQLAGRKDANEQSAPASAAAHAQKSNTTTVDAPVDQNSSKTLSSQSETQKGASRRSCMADVAPVPLPAADKAHRDVTVRPMLTINVYGVDAAAIAAGEAAAKQHAQMLLQQAAPELQQVAEQAAAAAAAARCAEIVAAATAGGAAAGSSQLIFDDVIPGSNDQHPDQLLQQQEHHHHQQQQQVTTNSSSMAAGSALQQEQLGLTAMAAAETAAPTSEAAEPAALRQQPAMGAAGAGDAEAAASHEHAPTAATTSGQALASASAPTAAPGSGQGTAEHSLASTSGPAGNTAPSLLEQVQQAMQQEGVTDAHWKKTHKIALQAWINAAGNCSQDMQALISISPDSLVKRLSEGYAVRTVQYYLVYIYKILSSPSVQRLLAGASSSHQQQLQQLLQGVHEAKAAFGKAAIGRPAEHADEGAEEAAAAEPLCDDETADVADASGLQAADAALGGGKVASAGSPAAANSGRPAAPAAAAAAAAAVRDAGQLQPRTLEETAAAAGTASGSAVGVSHPAGVEGPTGPAVSTDVAAAEEHRMSPRDRAAAATALAAAAFNAGRRAKSARGRSQGQGSLAGTSVEAAGAAAAGAQAVEAAGDAGAAGGAATSADAADPGSQLLPGTQVAACDTAAAGSIDVKGAAAAAGAIAQARRSSRKRLPADNSRAVRSADGAADSSKEVCTRRTGAGSCPGAAAIGSDVEEAAAAAAPPPAAAAAAGSSGKRQRKQLSVSVAAADAAADASVEAEPAGAAAGTTDGSEAVPTKRSRKQRQGDVKHAPQQEKGQDHAAVGARRSSKQLNSKAASQDCQEPATKAGGTSEPPDAGAASTAPVNTSRKAAGAAAAVPAAAAADNPCDGSDSEGLQDILDKQLGTNSPELEAAADAAGLPRLPGGPGLLHSETKEHGRRQRVVDCSSYRVGDHVGHHVKLFRLVDGSKDKPKEQLTVSCHDCQHQHVKWSCPHPQHRGQTSYCNKCLFKRYRATPWTLQDLHALCPLCRGACTCKACLRQPDHVRRQPAVQYDSDHLTRCGQYVLRLLGGQLGAWLDRQEVEAAAGGFSCLSKLPVEKLLEQERTNCDRCGSNLIGLYAHCGSCTWDICNTCLQELRRQPLLKPSAGYPGTTSSCCNSMSEGGAAGSRATFQWTCCNPTCESLKQQQQQPLAAAPLFEDNPVLDGKRQRTPCKRMAGYADEAELALYDEAMADHDHHHQQDEQVARPQPSKRANTGRRQRSKQQLQQQEVEEGKAEAEEAGAYGDEPSSIHGKQLFCQAGAGALELKLLLPHDLASDTEGAAGLLKQLRAVRESCINLMAVAADAPLEAHGMDLEDCPLLPAGAVLPLQDPFTGQVLEHPDTKGHLTLADLSTSDWWKLLPVQLRDVWRRKANSNSWLFTPSAEDLMLPQVAAAGNGDESAAGGSSSSSAAGSMPTADLARVTLATVLFWARWRQGEPIIVRECQGRVPWDPDTMCRAVKAVKGKEADERVAVIDCQDFHVATDIKAATFFAGYNKGYFRKNCDKPSMLKVKDWPNNSDFKEELPRHYMDFIERLPAKVYTDPRLGRAPLNLAACLHQSDNPTDLGPKCYCAYGRWEEAEAEGDSVTKLHQDMTDAINLLVDMQPGGDAVFRARSAAAAAGGSAVACEAADASAGGSSSTAGMYQQGAAEVAVVRQGDAAWDKPGYGGAGAVWDIACRADVARLSAFLQTHADRFIHQGQPVSSSDCCCSRTDPIMSQRFMLTEQHRQMLAQEEDPVELWHFEQHLDEGVFIPGGCPHQVRNLTSCCKVAVDFVSPEAVAICMTTRERLRQLDLTCGEPMQAPPQDRDHAEKLQSELIMMRAALTAAGLVRKPQVLPQSPEPEMPAAAKAARVHGRGKFKQQQQQEQPSGKKRSNYDRTKAAPAAGAASGKRRRRQQTDEDEDDDEDDDDEEEEPAEEDAGDGGQQGEDGEEEAGEEEGKRGQQLGKRASSKGRSGPGAAGRGSGRGRGTARGGRGAGGARGKQQRVGQGPAGEAAAAGEDADQEDEAAAGGGAAGRSADSRGQRKGIKRGKGSRR